MNLCIHACIRLYWVLFMWKMPKLLLSAVTHFRYIETHEGKKLSPWRKISIAIFNDLSEVVQLFEYLFTAKHYYPSMYVPFLTRILSCTEAPVSFSWNFHCFEELIPHFLCLEELRTLHIPLLSSLQSCLFYLNNLLTPDHLCIASSERITH